METIKFTKSVKNSTIIALLKGEKPEVNVPVDELIAYLEHENELIVKKSSKASGKPTANQVANAGIKTRIFEILSASDTPMCISDIIIALNEPYTNQKISALLKQMIVANMVVRTEIKGKAFFKNC